MAWAKPGAFTARQIYRHGFSGRRDKVGVGTLLNFFTRVLDWINHTITANRRSDGLYEANTN